MMSENTMSVYIDQSVSIDDALSSYGFTPATSL